MGKILFKLTPEIIDMIIFGMENQSDEYFVDISTGEVMSDTQVMEEYEDEIIDTKFIPEPNWLPADGFQLMESFVAYLHNPVQKETLGKVLSAGRGAFRNFKNTIKENESLTQQWYVHKEKVMKSIVIDWYNLNSEILKYNDIEENTDETENLILSDFIFTGNSKKWESLILPKSSEAVQESLGEEDTIIADYVISRNRIIHDQSGSRHVFISAETVGGDFAGFISGLVIGQEPSSCIISVVDIIWVEKIFRGLGIARRLVDEYSKNVRVAGVKRIVYELPGSIPTMVSTLEARGATHVFTTLAVKVVNM